MSGVNCVIIVGHLGQDPDVRYTASAKAVANLSIATSETWNDKQTGEKNEKTEWHRVVLWGRLGEIAGEYLAKGSLVHIRGRLETRKWEKDGIDRYTTEIIGQEMTMLGKNQKKESSGQATREQTQAERDYQAGKDGELQPQKERVPGSDDDFDDDIPF